jgi:gluconate 2-dehydrogenase gamma chain
MERRRFLAALGGGATALWLGDHFIAIEDAAAHAGAHAQSAQPRRFEFFTAAEARSAEAVAARIFPSDDGTPGAREAGAVHFMDRVLARHLPAERKTEVRAGLAALPVDFADLTRDRQDAVLRERETTPFFATMRTLTLAGVLSSPKYGGNRNYVGWKLVGHDPSPVYQPPFGYYDQPAVRRRLLGQADRDDG